MEDLSWSLVVSDKNHSVEYLWEEQFYTDPNTQETRSVGFWNWFVTPGTKERYKGFDDSFSEKMARAAVLGFRRAQLRAEFKEGEDGLQRFNTEEVILDLFARSEKGEFVGQSGNNSLLYVQDIAKVIGVDYRSLLDEVDRLVEEGKVGLYGMILITAEEYESNFQHWFEETGHKRLSVSDWGYWACAACGKNGEPEDGAIEKIPCV